MQSSASLVARVARRSSLHHRIMASPSASSAPPPAFSHRFLSIERVLASDAADDAATNDTGVRVLMLNKPDTLNSLTSSMAAEFDDALARLKCDGAMRAAPGERGSRVITDPPFRQPPLCATRFSLFRASLFFPPPLSPHPVERAAALLLASPAAAGAQKGHSASLVSPPLFFATIPADCFFPTHAQAMCSAHT